MFEIIATIADDPTLLATLTTTAFSTVAVEASRRQGRAAGCRDP